MGSPLKPAKRIFDDSGQGGPQSGPLPRGDLLLGLLIALIAFMLRFHNIGAASLWVDEGASLTFSRMSWSALFTDLPNMETNPPVFYAFLKGWVSLAGTSEFALRTPGAIASTLSVFILFIAARQSFGRTAAIVAASFLAFSALQVFYAQDARAYPFVTLLFVIGIWAALSLKLRLQSSNSMWGPIIALGGVAGVLPYWHYSGFFVAAILGVFVVVICLFNGNLRRIVLGLCGAAAIALVLVILPAIWVMSVTEQPDTPVGWLTVPAFWEAKDVFKQVLGHRYLPKSGFDWFASFADNALVSRFLSVRGIADLSLYLVCFVGVLSGLRRRNWAVIGLVIALGFSFVVFFGVSQVKPILIDRTVIFIVPLLALIVGYSVTVYRSNFVALFAAGCVLMFQATNLINYYPRAEAEPWRSLIYATQDAYLDDTAIVFSNDPFLSASISSAVLAEYYWPEIPKDRTFSIRADHTIQLYELGLSLTPWLQDLDLQAACNQFEDAKGVMVVYWREHKDEQLTGTLVALGSERLSRTPMGLVGYEMWSRPNCDE